MTDATTTTTRSVIRTMAGDVDPASLGKVLFHEHLVQDMTPWIDDPTLRLTDTDATTVELTQSKSEGLDLVVDATTPDFGRDIGHLARIAAVSPVHVVASAGLYRELTYPTWLDTLTEDQLADRLVTEVVEGIDGTTHRAGVLGEIGTSNDTVTIRERFVIRAVAQAHRRCGVPIITHTGEGAHALWQLQAYLDAGIDPAKIVIGHLDCRPDPALHREVAATGAHVGFDRVGMTEYVPDEVRADCILALVEAGFADRVLVSGDLARRTQLRPYGGDGYAQVFTTIEPLLRERGIDDATLGLITSENPRRFLAFSPPR